jgi:hypothetical protein
MNATSKRYFFVLLMLSFFLSGEAFAIRCQDMPNLPNIGDRCTTVIQIRMRIDNQTKTEYFVCTSRYNTF